MNVFINKWFLKDLNLLIFKNSNFLSYYLGGKYVLNNLSQPIKFQVDANTLN